MTKIRQNEPTEPERIRSEFSPTHHPYMHCINSTHRDKLCSTSVFNTMVEGVIGHVGSTDTATCLNIWSVFWDKDGHRSLLLQLPQRRTHCRVAAQRRRWAECLTRARPTWVVARCRVRVCRMQSSRHHRYGNPKLPYLKLYATISLQPDNTSTGLTVQ